MNYLGTEIPDDVYEYLKDENKHRFIYEIDKSVIVFLHYKEIKYVDNDEKKYVEKNFIKSFANIFNDYFYRSIVEIIKSANINVRLFKYITFSSRTAYKTQVLEDYIRIINKFTDVYMNLNDDKYLQSLAVIMNKKMKLYRDLKIEISNNCIKTILDDEYDYSDDSLYKRFLSNKHSKISETLYEYTQYYILTIFLLSEVDKKLYEKARSITVRLDDYKEIIMKFRGSLSIENIDENIEIIDMILNDANLFEGGYTNGIFGF